MAEVTAQVRLHGRRVGELSFRQGGSEFSYDDDLASPRHQVLGQIFEDDPRAIRRARVGVPAWFANLLPEGALRRQIVRELGGGNVGDFTLLLRVGGDLPGAVTVHADTEPEDDVLPDTPGEADHPLRHSLAGVQLKYSISAERLAVPVSGQGGWWIVKLPDHGLRDLPVNEYLTMSWLRSADFPVPPVRLIRADEVKGLSDGMVDPNDLVYLIQRFDRSSAGRIHAEDFAQVADIEPMFKYSESGTSYDTLAAVILQLTGEEGYLDFVRRLAAMLVVGNTDGHLKNWGLVYPDGRTPRLAPVYDFHSLSVYSRYRWSPLALSLGSETVPALIDHEHFRRLAEIVGGDPEATSEAISQTVSQLRDAWHGGLADEARSRFPALADHYSQRLETLPICRSR
ncbi:HipA domain-containing protein [Micromonospora sp. WMMD975]|uniref:type II toxin-antitoxin system HipA family toxin n=1 Tax=Micromonospora sp. WMMD975 TaxID=3016087 RepID=UPI00249BF9E5|nr:HipA domain-containing protein [Micromonospora sp. WMMD975]WFE34403.1 HipA domain-containing protein [Micromonospora sp. WMMD975]